MQLSVISLAALTHWFIGGEPYNNDFLRSIYHTSTGHGGLRPFDLLSIAGAILSLFWAVQSWSESEVAHPKLLSHASSPEIVSLKTSLPQERRWWRTLWPYWGVLAAALIVALDYFRNDGVTVMTWGALVALSFFVIGWQAVLLLDNQRLDEELRTLSANLEIIVAERTAQLRALHELSKAITATPEPDEVLEKALSHTRKIMQADAVILWLAEESVRERIEESYAAGVASTASAPGTSQATSSASSASLTAQEYHHLGVESHPEVLEGLEQHALKPVSDRVTVHFSGSEGQRVLTCLRAPLLWQDELLGMIGILRWERDWEESAPQLLESIGFEVGAALCAAHRYKAAVEAADLDSVTGLFNHRALSRRLDEELQRAARHGRELSVMMMDLNNFKWFNDTYGHPAGDGVLKQAAEVIHSEMRLVDVAGRYGGDEFLAILPDADGEAARLVAERLEHRVREESHFCETTHGMERPISLSFGIATFPVDSDNRHGLLAMADANLYNAKKSGAHIVRNRSEAEQSGAAPFPAHAYEVLEALVVAVDKKDHYTRRHSEEVAEYASWIAQELALSPETLRVLRLGALLHDVGKIGVPDETLREVQLFSPEEYEVMKRHPRLGALIVAGLPTMNAIVDIVRSHHERWDGEGYPDGLSGEKIPLLARILAVADAFSAMTTAHAHHIGLSWEAALEEIRANSGSQFDPQVVRAFLNAAAFHQKAEREKAAARSSA